MNAETVYHLGMGWDGSGLQWGRVLMNAETVYHLGMGWDGSGLQWGRVLMNAETPRCWRASSRRGYCFNGAAFS